MIHNNKKLNNHIMKNRLLISIFLILFFSNFTAFSKESIYLIEGIKHFENKEFDKSKILFERDLVFNPKSEKSYLYLAKIFNKKNNPELEELNLNTVILLNPSNEEAVFQLTLLHIKKSNYDESEKQIKKFETICKKLCSKKSELKAKLNDSLKK